MAGIMRNEITSSDFQEWALRTIENQVNILRSMTFSLNNDAAIL